MNKSEWKKFDIENKIRNILTDAKPHAKHHFGSHSFVSSYQIALEFKKRFPAEFLQLGKNLGGKGNGMRHTFAQYIGKQLSGGIRSRKIADIEGSFLFRKNLHSLQYSDKESLVVNSAGTGYDIALFKIKENSHENS